MTTEEFDDRIARLNKSADGFGDVVRVLTGLVAQYGFCGGRQVLQRVLPEWRPNWEQPG